MAACAIDTCAVLQGRCTAAASILSLLTRDLTVGISCLVHAVLTCGLLCCVVMCCAFVQGKEYSCYTLADQGRVIAHADTAAELSNLNYQYEGHPVIRQWVQQFVTRSGVSGQVRHHQTLSPLLTGSTHAWYAGLALFWLRKGTAAPYYTH